MKFNVTSGSVRESLWQEPGRGSGICVNRAKERKKWVPCLTFNQQKVGEQTKATKSILRVVFLSVQLSFFRLFFLLKSYCYCKVYYVFNCTFIKSYSKLQQRIKTVCCICNFKWKKSTMKLQRTSERITTEKKGRIEPTGMAAIQTCPLTGSQLEVGPFCSLKLPSNVSVISCWKNGREKNSFLLDKKRNKNNRWMALYREKSLFDGLKKAYKLNDDSAKKSIVIKPVPTFFRWVQNWLVLHSQYLKRRKKKPFLKHERKTFQLFIFFCVRVWRSFHFSIWYIQFFACLRKMREKYNKLNC